MTIILIRYDKPTTGKQRSLWFKADKNEDYNKVKRLVEDTGLTCVDHGGEFEVTPYHASNMIELLVLNDIEIRAEDEDAEARLKREGTPPPLEKKEDVVFPKFKVDPYTPQKEFLLFGLEKERILLADIMGGGKTLQALMMSEYLQAHYKFKHTLVINGVYNNQFNWKKEVEKFTYSDSYILGSRVLKSGPNRGKTQVRGNKEKLEDLEKGIDEHYIITNIAAIRNDKVVDKLLEMIYNRDIGFVVVDEIHYCVNSKSKQGKNLNKLRPRFRLGMSGTPFNEPMDMYDIEKWLGTTYKNFYDYKMEYGTEMITDKSRMIAARRRGMPFAEYIFNEPEKFARDIRRFMLRRTSILEGLPTLRFQDVYVEMGPKQREAYDNIASVGNLDSTIESLEQLQEELNKPTYFEERKVMSNPHLYGVEEDIKLETVKELLEEIIANDKTAIVYGFFIETMKNYERELSKSFPGKGNYITDDTEDVFQVIEEFQEGKGNFLVGGVKKIGTGFNITRADYVIYADRPATWNDFEQSFMRAWRNGRTEPVTVIKVLCIDTWDDRMSWNLLERKRQSESVLGKNHKSDNVIDGRYE